VSSSDPSPGANEPGTSAFHDSSETRCSLITNTRSLRRTSGLPLASHEAGEVRRGGCSWIVQWEWRCSNVSGRATTHGSEGTKRNDVGQPTTPRYQRCTNQVGCAYRSRDLDEGSALACELTKRDHERNSLSSRNRTMRMFSWIHLSN